MLFLIRAAGFVRRGSCQMVALICQLHLVTYGFAIVGVGSCNSVLLDVREDLFILVHSGRRSLFWQANLLFV